MAINVIDTIKPKNNGNFPIVEAADVEMPDGTRLSDFKIEIPEVSAELPVFDLGSLGMDAVSLPMGQSSLETDTNEILAALTAGAVKFAIPVSMTGATITVYAPMHGFTDGTSFMQCASLVVLNAALILMVVVESGSVTVSIAPAGTMLGIPAVSEADNGKIMQVVEGAWAAVELATWTGGSY